MHFVGKILKCSFFYNCLSRNHNTSKKCKPNEILVLFKVPNVKVTFDLLSKATHLDHHTPIYKSFSPKSLGCLMDYSLDCLDHLTKIDATPIYG